MSVTAFYGKRALRLGVADAIPEPDAEQVVAAYDMVEDINKLLLSDPGAGKTLTALQAMMLVEERLDEGEDPRPDITAVIVVPNIAIGTWVRWIYAAYVAADRDAVIQVVSKGSDAIRLDATHVILTYGMVSHRETAPVVDALRKSPYAIFIADESDNLTGTDSNRSVTVFGQGFKCGPDALSHNAIWSWFLTGTAIPRWNDGLFPVLRAKFPHKLRNLVTRNGTEYGNALDLETFVHIFCVTEQVKYGSMQHIKTNICGSRNNPLLNSILYGGTFPIAIRIKLKLEDYVEREITIEPKFTKEFLTLEEELETLPHIDTHGNRLIDSRLATAQRLLGIQSAPEVVKHVLAVHKDDQRNSAVTLGKTILYVHTEAGNIIANELTSKGFKVRMINGSTKSEDDMETERMFNAGEVDFVVGQIIAMGVAINLQEHCDYVAFAEETYSHSKNLQALQRVWRRGQKRKVRVDRCRAMTFLAVGKASSAERKGSSASEVLDGR